MSPAARTELDPSATCRACGRALPAGSAVCPGCGAAHGETNRCPHCNAIADVEPHAGLGFRCLVCGGPRVALDVAGVTPGAPTLSALRVAAERQTEHVMYTAAGLVLSGMGALALVIATLVVLAASPGLVPTLAAYLGALVPTAAGLAALARAASARQRRGQSLRAAEVAALADVQAVTGVLDAKRVAEIMRLPPERAELLLAEASVASLLEQAPAPRVRVAPAAETQLGDEPAAAERVLNEPGERRGPIARGGTEI
jgi:hypothetical protein